MVDLSTMGVDTSGIRRLVVREVEKAKRDVLHARKSGLIEASAGEDETVERVGATPGPVTEGLRSKLAAEYDIPEDALISEVHFEVEQPITVRYSSAETASPPAEDEPTRSDDRGTPEQ